MAWGMLVFALPGSELMGQDSFYSPLPQHSHPTGAPVLPTHVSRGPGLGSPVLKLKASLGGAIPFPLSYLWHLFQFCLSSTAPGSPPTSQASPLPLLPHPVPLSPGQPSPSSTRMRYPEQTCSLTPPPPCMLAKLSKSLWHPQCKSLRGLHASLTRSSSGQSEMLPSCKLPREPSTAIQSGLGHGGEHPPGPCPSRAPKTNETHRWLGHWVAMAW